MAQKVILPDNPAMVCCVQTDLDRLEGRWGHVLAWLFTVCALPWGQTGMLPVHSDVQPIRKCSNQGWKSHGATESPCLGSNSLTSTFSYAVSFFLLKTNHQLSPLAPLHQPRLFTLKSCLISEDFARFPLWPQNIHEWNWFMYDFTVWLPTTHTLYSKLLYLWVFPHHMAWTLSVWKAADNLKILMSNPGLSNNNNNNNNPLCLHMTCIFVRACACVFLP